jgi:hypothetical protein
MGLRREPPAKASTRDAVVKEFCFELPPIPATESLHCTLPSDRSLNLLSLPCDVRQLIYDQIIPLGPLIVLRIHAHTTLLKHLYALSQTCRYLNSEITTYLTTRPLTILCDRSLSPSIMNGIPPRILAKVETLAIEDTRPITEPTWRLLPSISTICFTEIYDTHIQPTPTPTPTASASPCTSSTTQQSTSIPQYPTTLTPTYPPTPSSLPTNNTVLSHAHKYWQNLRLGNQWILQLWKRDLAPYDTLPHVRVILRRVFEGLVSSEQEAGSQGAGEKVVVTWHGVVDVDSRKVLENRYLGTRRMETRPGAREEEEVLFPYAAQTWWRKEMVVEQQRSC